MSLHLESCIIAFSEPLLCYKIRQNLQIIEHQQRNLVQYLRRATLQCLYSPPEAAVLVRTTVGNEIQSVSTGNRR